MSLRPSASTASICARISFEDLSTSSSGSSSKIPEGIRFGSTPFTRWGKAEGGGGGAFRLLRVVDDREIEGVMDLPGSEERLGVAA